MLDATSAIPGAPIPRGNELLACSGTRRLLRDNESVAIWNFLRTLGDWTGFVTGGCTGIDHFCGEHLARLFPQAHHIVVVPGNRSRIAAWWRKFETSDTHIEVIELDSSSTYRDRNLRLVALSGALFAVPEYPERASGSRRSGTWQTVRMARTAHDDGKHTNPPLVVPLSTLAT
jgi:hypothetical protein